MFGAIAHSIRHRSLPYLRPLRSLPLASLAAGAALALAAALSPSFVVPKASAATTIGLRAWNYWCSMLLGASPLLALGGLVAAVASRVPRRWKGAVLLATSICLPGCDCTINAYCGELARLPPTLAAFAVVWGACCNPVALVATSLVLGPRMALDRALCGFVAACLTAVAWRRFAALPAMHSNSSLDPFWERCANAIGAGLGSFSVAAVVASIILVVGARHVANAPGLVAAALGAVLSPCSSSDSILARVLFAHPKSQLSFVIAAQCLDVRQVLMLRRHFGFARAFFAVGSSATACALGYAVA